jgi:thiamine-monophosphate kinase
VPGEFELIQRYFADRAHTNPRQEVILGIGDDAAITSIPAGQQLVTTTDVLVEGVHFPKKTKAADIAYKALAVNLSDLAAMGADPCWFTLTLSMPTAEPGWLQEFSEGLFAIAESFDVTLIGGDTVRGPLVVGIQACGLVPKDKALLRSGAKAGDAIYVSGTLGDATLALQYLNGVIQLSEEECAMVMQKLNRPLPCVEQGKSLRDVANSCIDISDGLVADLSHILEASHVGATVHQDDIPLSPIYRRYMDKIPDRLSAITFGDDYELCFTVPSKRIDMLDRLVKNKSGLFTRIGSIEAEPGLRVRDTKGKVISIGQFGHDHFHEASNY